MDDCEKDTFHQHITCAVLHAVTKQSIFSCDENDETAVTALLLVLPITTRLYFGRCVLHETSSKTSVQTTHSSAGVTR